jgi:uncharacterized protein YeeX (DUF496 family)
LLGLGAAIYVGYFDKQRLDLDKAKLQYQIRDLETEKQTLDSNLSVLQAQRRDLLQSISDTESERVRAESHLAQVADAADSIRETYERRFQEYQSANQSLANRNRELDQQVGALRDRLVAAEQEARAARGDSDSARREMESMRDELLLMPPLLSGGSILDITGEPRIRGEVVGANLGNEKGIIVVRAIRTRRAVPGQKRSREPDTPSEVLLTLTVPPDLIRTWKSREISFEFSPADRKRILETRDSVGSGSSWAGSTPVVEFQASIKTALGGETGWQTLSTGWSFSASF